MRCCGPPAVFHSSLLGSHLGRSYWTNVLKHLVLDIIAGGIVHSSKGEICFFQRGTHHLFVIHDLKGDSQSSLYQLQEIAQFIYLFKNHTNTHSQSISFLFKKLVSRVGTL
jgi:hypothetical protein